MSDEKQFVKSGIRDNYMYGRVADFLLDKIQSGSALSIVSAYFTIYAYNELRNSLEGIEKLRFLFGEPSFIHGLDPTKTERGRLEGWKRRGM